MIPGIVAAQPRATTAAAPELWTPLNMVFVPEIYLDGQDSVVTDVSGFASAISNLGGMGSNGDFSQGTAGNRPSILAAELNGKRVLSFDGSNDFMSGSTLTIRNLFNARAAAWSFAVYKKRGTDGSDTARFLLLTTDNAGATRFSHASGWVSGGANKQAVSVRRVDGGSVGTLIGATASSGSYSMGMTAVNMTTRAGRIYLNGSLDGENTTLTAAAGNFSNTSASINPSIGANSAGGLASDIDLAALIVSNVYPSDSDIDKLFGWAAHKYGLTANLPGGHPYKTVAPTV